MAGGALKGIGITFIVLGGLAIVLGLGAAGYGAFAEDANNDRMLADPEESDRNELLIVGGLATAAGGLVFTLGGIALTVWGGSRARAEDRGENVTLTAPLVVASLLALAALGGAWALTGGPDAGGELAAAGNVFTRESSAPVEPLLVDEQSGTAAGVGVPVVGSVSSPEADFVKPVNVAEGAASLRVEFTWECGTALSFLLEARDGDGWTLVEEATGGCPLALDVTDAAVLAGELRVRAFVDEGASPGEAFTFHASSFQGAVPEGYSALPPAE